MQTFPEWLSCLGMLVSPVPSELFGTWNYNCDHFHRLAQSSVASCNLSNKRPAFQWRLSSYASEIPCPHLVTCDCFPVMHIGLYVSSHSNVSDLIVPQAGSLSSLLCPSRTSSIVEVRSDSSTKTVIIFPTYKSCLSPETHNTSGLIILRLLIIFVYSTGLKAYNYI